MYLMQQTPARVFNIKWDLDHTPYDLTSQNAPGLPSAPPAAPIIPARRAPAVAIPAPKRPCIPCRCARKPSLSGLGISARGITTPPQKRMGRLNGLGYSTDPPANAAQYQPVCLRPLPSNTQIDAVVPFPETNTVDFYYTNLTTGQKWVCTTTVQDANDPSTWAAAGQLQSPVVNINPADYEPTADTSLLTILGVTQPGGSLTAGGSLLSWFSTNWPLVAAGAAALFAAKELA